MYHQHMLLIRLINNILNRINHTLNRCALAMTFDDNQKYQEYINVSPQHCRGLESTYSFCLANMIYEVVDKVSDFAALWILVIVHVD